MRANSFRAAFSYVLEMGRYHVRSSFAWNDQFEKAVKDLLGATTPPFLQRSHPPFQRSHPPFKQGPHPHPYRGGLENRSPTQLLVDVCFVTCLHLDASMLEHSVVVALELQKGFPCIQCSAPTRPKVLLDLCPKLGNGGEFWGPFSLLAVISWPHWVDLGRWPGLIQGLPKGQRFVNGTRLHSGQVSWSVADGFTAC